MSASDIVSIITAVGTLLLAILTLWLKRDVKTVHQLVNERSEKQETKIEKLTARTEQLTEALEGSDTAVPEKP